MALSLRLRRALSLSPSLLHNNLQLHSSRKISTFLLNPSLSSNLDAQKSKSPFVSNLQCFRFFQSSPVFFSSRRNLQDDQEIGPDTIPFEGCCYNRFLIIIDFPRDQELSAEQMVETFIQTAAKVFGSVEEAQKRIYAYSTTTYKGFQVECSEETSEKFKDVPGVLCILPAVLNKEDGGNGYQGQKTFKGPGHGQSQSYMHFNRLDNYVGGKLADQYVDPIDLFYHAQKSGRILLGLDVREKSIGVALSDESNRIAHPLSVIRCDSGFTSAIAELHHLISTMRCAGLVFGEPYAYLRPDVLQDELDLLLTHMQDSDIRFMQDYDMRFTFWNKAFSSEAVEAMLKPFGLTGSRHEQMLVKFSSTCILQAYLDEMNRS